MNYVKVTDGVAERYTLRQLKLDNPSTSFPKSYPDDILAEYDVYLLVDGEVPQEDVVELGPIEQLEGVWTQTYIGRAFTDEEKRIRLRAPRLACRLVLIEAGLWQGIAGALEGMPETTAEESLDKQRALAFFEDAREWKRTDATVVMLGAALGIDAAGLDALFEQAIALDASL